MVGERVCVCVCKWGRGGGVGDNMHSVASISSDMISWPVIFAGRKEWPLGWQRSKLFHADYAFVKAGESWKG